MIAKISPRTGILIVFIISISSYFLLPHLLVAMKVSYLKSNTHNKLSPANLTVIDLAEFKFLLTSDICCVSPLALVTLVHSAPGNRASRDMIRGSWGRWAVGRPSTAQARHPWPGDRPRLPARPARGPPLAARPGGGGPA